MNTVRLNYVARPSRKESLSGRAALEPLMKVMGGFLAVVFILFVHVWIPIQSERNLAAMRRLESQVSLKKAELNELNDQYAKMTSLTALDHWAKSHGPWVPAQVQNVLTIEK